MDENCSWAGTAGGPAGGPAGAGAERRSVGMCVEACVGPNRQGTLGSRSTAVMDEKRRFMDEK